MLVANPDLVRPDGKDSPMPGQLAARYRALAAELGLPPADVREVGKPHALVYEVRGARAVGRSRNGWTDTRIVASSPSS